MMLSKKKEGFATIPLLLIFLIFMMITMGIYISYEESQRIIYRTDDAVTISLQGVCLFDRYEYATGSMYGKEIVCFYPGAENIKYSPGNDTQNMAVTKSACEFAYQRYKSVLPSNVSDHYVIVPPEASGGLSSYIKKFEMTNVYEDTAYVYDYISKTTNIITPATGMKSILTVEMEIDMRFPLYGEKTIQIVKTGKLESRIN